MRKTSLDALQERIPKIVHQLRFQCVDQGALDLLHAVLLNLGFTEPGLTYTNLGGVEIIDLFDEDAQRISKHKDLFVRLGLKGVKVSQHRLLPKDWLTLWKKQWKPAPLTRKLDVVPVWYQHKYKPSRGRDFILMDTLLSFGTGLHETTQFVAQLIEDNRGNFKSFLDIGTGTGILAFVALKNGASEVKGIDIGQLSLEAARQNMKANQLHFKLSRADISRYRPTRTYDLVAANLITEDLIHNARKIIKCVKKGGLLAVSGISLDNLGRLTDAFSLLPLKCLKVSKGKQWSALLYQRSVSLK